MPSPVELVFAVKVVATLGLSGAIALLLRYRSRLEAGLQTRQSVVLISLVIAMRVVPFVLVYGVLNETPRGDIPFFYWKAALAQQGKLVYRDFWSFHSPLFAYILALPLYVWHSPKAIVLLIGLGEVLCVWLTYRFYRTTQSDAFWKTVVYLLLPGPLIICLLGGQEDIWLWGFGLWAVRVWQRTGSAFGVGLVMALALLTLKVTFVLIVFPVFFLMQQRTPFVGALLAVGLPAVLVLYAGLGWLFLMPVQHAELPFAPNLVSVLRPLTGGWLAGVPIRTLNWIGMSLTLLLATFTGWWFRRKPLDRVFPALWIITFGGLMLFQPSAMAYYLFVFLLAIVFELTNLTNGRQVGMLLVFNLLVVVQPFVMTYSGQPMFNSPAMLREPLYLLEYGLELAFIGCLLYYLRQAWLRLSAL